jgi:hypothetical protein
MGRFYKTTFLEIYATGAFDARDGYFQASQGQHTHE